MKRIRRGESLLDGIAGRCQAVHMAAGKPGKAAQGIDQQLEAGVKHLLEVATNKE